MDCFDSHFSFQFSLSWFSVKCDEDNSGLHKLVSDNSDLLSGRIKFGMFSVKRDEDNSGLRKLVARYPHVSPLPAYLVITPEKTHR